jgi:hypothetical protein
MKALLLFFCLTFCALPGFARKLVPLQTGKVVWQNIGSYNGGAVGMPIGTMYAAIPIVRQSNTVVIETGNERLTWSETGRHMLVLPVNGTIQFYQDGKWYIVLDSQRKKHKFALVHMETIGNGVGQ